jgi:hypothetical protein
MDSIRHPVSIRHPIESPIGIENRIDRKSTSSEHHKPTSYRTWYELWKITIYISWEWFTQISVNIRFRKLQTNKQTDIRDLVYAHKSSVPPPRVSLTINREIANAIFEGAKNARGGERQFAAGRGLAESNLHRFELVQLLL